jgi:AAA domain
MLALTFYMAPERAMAKFLTYICALPHPKKSGRIPELLSADPSAIEEFARRWDKPGRGVYTCVSPLRAGSRRRLLENVACLQLIHCDIDLRSLKETYDEVLHRLRQLPLRLELRDSGGGFHVVVHLKEWLPADTEEFARGNAARERLTRVLCADPAPNHAAALLRKPGTHNFKYEGEPRPCRIIQEGEPADITEIEDLLDLLGDKPLFTPVERATNGHDHAEGAPRSSRESRAPVDVEARLAAMRFHGAGDNGIHLTQLHCTASLLRSGVPVEDAVTEVLEATRRAVANDPSWDWNEERLTIERKCYDFISKNPELSVLLPDGLAVAWAERQAEGRTNLRIVHARHIGWHVRSQGNSEGDDPGTGSTSKDEKAKPKYRFKLVPFEELQLGNDPLYLVDELIPVRGLVDVWGKAKCYKSFWVFDLCLHIAMGWEYRDRYVQEGVVVYCAFEGAHGYKKRKEAARRHYNIAEDVHVPLYLMPGQANLIADHAELIASIKGQIDGAKPEVVVLDTLNKSLHGSENKDQDMSAYIRAAEAIRDAFDCVVIIVHHCGYDDTRPRGHSSLPAAVDAQLAVTRVDRIVTVTVEMMRDGPEEIQVVSEAVEVEVGVDRNGKRLTSLVVVPSDADALAPGRRDWSRGLNVFYAAVKSALGAHGEIFQPEAGVLPIRAVNQEFVRKRFYDTYAEGEEDTEKRQNKLRQAFNRVLGDAQKGNLIKTMQTKAGCMIWLPGREG